MAWSREQIRIHDPSTPRRKRIFLRIRRGIRSVFATLGIFILGWLIAIAAFVAYFGAVYVVDSLGP